jgi:hypothetical protein
VEGANDPLAVGPTLSPPLSVESVECKACGAESEPGFAIPLCADCRTKLARRPIPFRIKLVAGVLGILLLAALTRIPSSISAAVAFERGQNDEQKAQFTAAEHKYQQAVQIFPKSDLAHARLFVAAYRARDGAIARHEFEYLRGRRIDAKIVGEINALLSPRH